MTPSPLLPGEITIDLFAGAGGASKGVEAAIGQAMTLALNHDEVALAVHKANHPYTTHLEADIWKVDPAAAVHGRRVGIMWASPDCTTHSYARGGKPRKQHIRSLANAVVKWARATRPRMIFVENVREFQKWGPLYKSGPRKGQPIKAKEGTSFNRWVAELRNLNYTVEWRVLRASDFGAPTSRKRLLIICRCDGEAINWPAPRYGAAPLLPVRTAAECIDWDRHARSIFGRKKPLKPKTMWRIAEGIRKFVIENPTPFIVEMNHKNRPRDVRAPLNAITTQGNRFNLVMPTLAKVNHGGKGRREARGEDVREPLSTVTAQQRGHMLASAVVTPIDQRSAAGRGRPANEPLNTIVTKQRHALTTANLIQVSYGERKGQKARLLNLHDPLGTIVAQGQKHGLVQCELELEAAYVAKHYGDPGRRKGGGKVFGKQVNLPLDTITAVDHHSLVAAALVKFRGMCNGASANEPMPTITAKGMHMAEVRAFLTKHCGKDVGLGIVRVEGVAYQIVDITMRMLEPEELGRAQFGRFAAGYDLRAALTKKDKVRLIGNSVPPEMAEAVVGANVGRWEALAA